MQKNIKFIFSFQKFKVLQSKKFIFKMQVFSWCILTISKQPPKKTLSHNISLLLLIQAEKFWNATTFELKLNWLNLRLLYFANVSECNDKPLRTFRKKNEFLLGPTEGPCSHVNVQLIQGCVPIRTIAGLVLSRVGRRLKMQSEVYYVSKVSSMYESLAYKSIKINFGWLCPFHTL